MYKIVTKGSENEVWAVGFYSKEKAQKKIDEGYWHKYMYDKDKHKTLIVIKY